MAGHSKWANIQHRKGRQDAKRGKIFTRLIKEITVSARMGGGDPAMNPRLRLAVDKATENNMPKDNIERAIARGTGAEKGEQLERVVYEGYGPASVAIMVATTTDNRNRTVGLVRSAFNKYGGNLGENGSVAWQFEQRGVIQVPADGIDPDDLALAAIDAGALDVELGDEVVTVVTDPAAFRGVKAALTTAGYNTDDATLSMVSTVPMDLDDDQTLKVLKFIDILEDIDDVDEVYTNASFSDAAVEQFAMS